MEAVDTILKSWYDLTRGMNPRSIDCKAGSLNTMLSRRQFSLLSEK